MQSLTAVQYNFLNFCLKNNIGAVSIDVNEIQKRSKGQPPEIRVEKPCGIFVNADKVLNETENGVVQHENDNKSHAGQPFGKECVAPGDLQQKLCDEEYPAAVVRTRKFRIYVASERNGHGDIKDCPDDRKYRIGRGEKRARKSAVPFADAEACEPSGCGSREADQ